MTLIIPTAPFPNSVKAVFTTRLGGVSAAPYSTLNLGTHVGDRAEHVAKNRLALQAMLLQRYGKVPVIQWLKQVHSTEILELSFTESHELTADGLITAEPYLACAVMTADCLPVLISDKRGEQVAAIHAGWRGLAEGILSKAIARFSMPASELVCCIGPAISQRVFDVGPEVSAQFIAAQRLRNYSQSVETFIVKKPRCVGKFLLDLSGIARAELEGVGVSSVTESRLCTFSNPSEFYSYRRDGVTGRMASLIWRDPS